MNLASDWYRFCWYTLFFNKKTCQCILLSDLYFQLRWEQISWEFFWSDIRILVSEIFIPFVKSFRLLNYHFANWFNLLNVTIRQLRRFTDIFFSKTTFCRLRPFMKKMLTLNSWTLGNWFSFIKILFDFEKLNKNLFVIHFF